MNIKDMPVGTRFAHFRDVQYPGGYPSVQSRSGMTLAYVQDGDKVLAAAAFCHSSDNYCKYLGRQKAVGQLNRLLKYRTINEETIAGERFFVLDGNFESAIPKLLQQLEQDTGYVRIHKVGKKDRVVL